MPTCRSRQPMRRWSPGLTAISVALVETIRQLDLSRDTLIVFTSDHGATFESGNGGTSAALDSNRPFRGQKRTLWEGGVRVPALVWWPGHVPAGVAGKEVVQLIDLLPTFVAAAGGRSSLAGTWMESTCWTFGPASPPQPSERFSGNGKASGPTRSPRCAGQFKLLVTGGGRSELYDVVGDPAERRDVSAEHPELTKELRDELGGLAQDRSPPGMTVALIPIFLLNAPVSVTFRPQHLLSLKGFRPMNAKVYVLTMILGFVGVTRALGAEETHPPARTISPGCKDAGPPGGCSP